MTEDDRDVERIFMNALPRQPSAELRDLVLAGVAAQLGARQERRQLDWQAWLPRAVAASLVFSMAAYFGVERMEARRMARWDNRTVVRSSITHVTALIASVSSEEAARRIECSLLQQLRTRDRPGTVTLHREVEIIQRWANDDPQVPRNQSDETTQNRI